MDGTVEDWRRRCELEQRIRMQREDELRHQREYVTQLEQRCNAAEQTANSRQALDAKAGVLAKVATTFSQSLPSSVDRNIHAGCEEVIHAVSEQHRITTPQEARAEIVDALRDVLEIAGDPEMLSYGDGEVLQLAMKSNLLSVKGIVLMGIWTVFKNVSDSGDGDMETLLPDSAASIETMIAKYEDDSESDAESDAMSEDGGAELLRNARDTSSNASPPLNGPVIAADARDQFLIDERRKGTSYGDIKRLGGFQEAESTLRGRYRVLVKSKSDRVRKPEWSAKDRAILREAVRDTVASSPALGYNKRIPWKRVGDRMKELGASYHFGPGTCAKQWDKIKIADKSRGH